MQNIPPVHTSQSRNYHNVFHGRMTERKQRLPPRASLYRTLGMDNLWNDVETRP